MEASMLELNTATLLSRATYGCDMFLTEADMRQDGSTVTIDIKEGARVATDRDGRWLLSDKSNPRWRWSQGGALPILVLRDTIVTPLQLSDPSLPIYANHLTAATGLASSPEEWLYPRRLIREAFEEVAVATPTGLVVPVFGDAELDALSWGTLPAVMEMIEKQGDLSNLFNLGLFNRVRAEFVPLREEREINVHVFGKPRSSTKALPVIDPTTRGIDVMYAFKLDLSAWKLDEVSIFCAESRAGTPTNSEMACLELSRELKPVRIVKTFKSGLPIQGSGSLDKVSPVLQKVLSGL